MCTLNVARDRSKRVREQQLKPIADLRTRSAQNIGCYRHVRAHGASRWLRALGTPDPSAETTVPGCLYRVTMDGPCSDPGTGMLRSPSLRHCSRATAAPFPRYRSKATVLPLAQFTSKSREPKRSTRESRMRVINLSMAAALLAMVKQIKGIRCRGMHCQRHRRSLRARSGFKKSTRGPILAR